MGNQPVNSSSLDLEEGQESPTVRGRFGGYWLRRPSIKKIRAGTGSPIRCRIYFTFLIPIRFRVYFTSLAMDSKTLDRIRTFTTYNSWRARRRTVPDISDELVFDILIRLPVKDLVRFKTVSKAWRAMISDPLFIRKQLQQSTNKYKQSPSFLIVPHTLDRVIDSEAWPTTFSNNFPFYVWQEGHDNACLLHTTGLHGEFESVYFMSHCDGLVMLPTNTKVYVFNPATGDVLKLPDGQKNERSFQTAGFGLDPRTNKYKVVRSFYRSVDFSMMTYDAGMEVFTIGCDATYWRATTVDPPYPVRPQVPVYFKGSLYWHICDKLLKQPSGGFLRFNLEDETFSFIHTPVPSNEVQLELVELAGELCLAQYQSTEIVIWVLQDGGNYVWDRLYVIHLSEACEFRPLGMLNNGILVRKDNRLYCYDQTSKEREMVCVDQLRFKNPRGGSLDFVGENLFFFNITPYTESLVPLV